MVQGLQKTITSQSSKLEALEKEVHKKTHVFVDQEKVGAIVASKVSDSAVKQIGKKFAESIGNSLQELEPKLTKTDESVRALGKHLDFYGDKFEKYRKLSWGDISRLAVAVLPVLVALVMIVGLGNIVTSALGLGAWLPWIWSFWLTVPTWWGKLLALIPALGLVIFMGWLIYRVGKWIYEKYQGW